jgi:hypothetical protein
MQTSIVPERMLAMRDLLPTLGKKFVVFFLRPKPSCRLAGSNAVLEALTESRREFVSPVLNTRTTVLRLGIQFSITINIGSAHRTR